MVKDLIYEHLAHTGCPKWLFEQMFRIGQRPYLAWFTQRFCRRQDFETLIDMFPDELDYKIVKAAFYGVKPLPKTPENMQVVQMLNELYPYPEYWDLIMPYAMRHIRMIVAETLLVRTSLTVMEIAERVGLSVPTVYSIRKRSIWPYLDIKEPDYDA